MDSQRKKELKAQAAGQVTLLGVYSVTRKDTGKVFVASSRNLKNQWERLRAQLSSGAHPNRELQDDWKASGETAFSFEILESGDAAQVADPKTHLASRVKEWAQRLGAYDGGYNKIKGY